jgi:hypothetical protein
MTGGWQALTDELDIWAAEGRSACFWWRDDDATDATPALERLLRLHSGSGIPLALAVIPALAKPALADRLRVHPSVAALQHGYAHRNQAGSHEKKSEFPAARPQAERLDDMRVGRGLLDGLFGPRLQPIFVPPWNRLAADCLPAMPGLGYVAVSAFKPRNDYWAAPRLAALNTHIDPIDWHGADNAAAIARCLAAACAHLRAMRLGQEPLQPIGLLTHHLRHDETVWAFVSEFQARTAAHAAVHWLDVVAALQVGAPGSHSPSSVMPAS